MKPIIYISCSLLSRTEDNPICYNSDIIPVVGDIISIDVDTDLSTIFTKKQFIKDVGEKLNLEVIKREFKTDTHLKNSDNLLHSVNQSVIILHCGVRAIFRID